MKNVVGISILSLVAAIGPAFAQSEPAAAAQSPTAPPPTPILPVRVENALPIAVTDSLTPALAEVFIRHLQPRFETGKRFSTDGLDLEVPVGKRFVLLYASIGCDFFAPTEMIVEVDAGADGGQFIPSESKNFSGLSSTSVASSPLNMIIDQGATIRFALDRNRVDGPSNGCSGNLTGYLIPTPR